ncbi:hypothetical protein GCM10009304_17100 [Pseudomonas matsuisoli]|uniref:Uncharacterized protein n=1 Tax=Pseudomonas matsuisoli TaxID=1515666 RepID=A0A917PU92_9PSED|nr:hypothetical protein GCM10009304_17100 [Pseudomonas matsuisoli]
MYKLSRDSSAWIGPVAGVTRVVMCNVRLVAVWLADRCGRLRGLHPPYKSKCFMQIVLHVPALTDP